MAASDFEFKNRFWIFSAVFCLAYSSYSVDHQNAGVALVEWLAHIGGKTATSANYHLVFAIAALFCVAAALLRTWSTAYLTPEVMIDKQIHTSCLVADGPYRYVRNPLYLGNILLAVGFGLMASRTGLAILLLGIFLFAYRLILREEAEIEASQGDRFRAYRNTVPRLLPSLTPKVPSGRRPPNWPRGFLGEAFIWVMALAVAAFACSLNLKVYFVILSSSFVAYAISLAIIKRQHTS